MTVKSFPPIIHLTDFKCFLVYSNTHIYPFYSKQPQYFLIRRKYSTNSLASQLNIYLHPCSTAFFSFVNMKL